MKRNTTPEKLLDAINNKKLSVIGGKIYSVDMVRNYPPDQFVEELEFLCESGCFAEMIDIKYEVAVGHVLLDIGRIISAEGEYNTDADTLYITCKLKNSLTVYFMIINVSGSENRTDKYDEMDVYQLNDFLEDVLHEKNEYYCVFTRITDVFGFDLKMRNCIRTYVNTLDDSDWKLHISDDFTSFEVPVTDDSINEIYVKDNAESRSIIVKPYNQPFMEIDMLFFKKHN